MDADGIRYNRSFYAFAADMPFLDWVNKNQAKETPREVPYHLLKLEESYGDPVTAGENMLIQGDNLLALKALLPLYAGRVKCVAIDVPYNTKSAFEHYDDNLEHSQWLSMMYPRLVLLRELLAEDGSIWIFVDDNEAHYLKVLVDEVFGRSNFIANIVWQSKDTPGNNSTGVAQTHNHLLGWSRGQGFSPNRLSRTNDQDKYYSNPDEDSRGAWLGTPLTRAEHRDRDYYPIKSPDGREVLPPKGSSWRRPPEIMKQLEADNRIWWGKKGDAAFPKEKKFLSEVKQDVVNQTWWPYEFGGSTRNASVEMKAIFGHKAFDTPKPEKVVARILAMASQPGDLVLDSFLGSGTTAAVAHKMKRRYIGIEMGEHAKTHCLPRLLKVIEGDGVGISESEGWTGGGGFSFYTLGEPAFDEGGRLNPAVRFKTLAAYVWSVETGRPGTQEFDSPLLGVHDGNAYFLLYNGILGDLRPEGGNVLTNPVLAHLRELHPAGTPMVVYGETSRLGPARLAAEGITFKQIPYDVKMR